MKTTRKQILLIFGLALYLLVFALGLSANATAPSLEVSLNWNEAHWEVVESSPPFQEGDQIVRLSGSTVEFATLLVDNAYLGSRTEFLQWLDQKESLYKHLQKPEIEISVLRRGEEQTLTAKVSQRSVDILRNPVMVHLPVSFIFLLVGWGTYRRPNSSSQALWFYLLCLSMSLVYLTNVMSLLAQPVLEPTIFKLLNFLNMANFVFGPALLLHFALLMPRDRAPKWLLVLIYGSSIVSVLALALPVHAVLVPLFFLASLVAIAQGAWAYRKPIERAQMKWVGVGFLLGIGPWFFTNGLSLMLTGERLMSDTLPGACLVFIPIFMAVAIQRYRLFDVGSFLEGTFVYISTIVLLMVVDLSILSALGSNVTPNQTYVLTLALVLALYGPVRNKISHWVSSFAGRSKIQELEALNFLKQELDGPRFGDVTAALQNSVQRFFAPESFEIVKTGELEVGAHFELQDAPTVMLSIAKGLALRCGPLGYPRTYSSKDLEILETLTQHCALTYRNLELTQQYLAEQNLRLKEREQLLGDLHDGVGSSLANIRLLSQEDHISQLAGDALFELQNFLYDSPEYTLEKSQFCADVRNYCEQTLGHSPIELQWKVSGDTRGSIPRPRALSVFRAIREAIANALKHSEATTLSILWNFGDRLEITIRDDGRGLGQDSIGRGLKGMERRIQGLNGEFSYQTNPGLEIKIVL